MYTFEEIKGCKQIKKNLQNAVTSGRVSHAYIINGGVGMGKKLLANTFAKTLQCEGKGSEPCGYCTSCKAFDTNNHPDVFYVSPQKTKGLGVHDIREQIIKNVEVKQYKYQYKIFIVDKADEMTVAAQNALLKTLEEPPPYAVFLLLAKNIESFLPTILSRCVTLKLRPLPNKTVEEFLLNQGLAQVGASGVFAEYAQGSIGQAIEMACSGDFTDMREDILEKLTLIGKKDLVAVMAMAKELEIYKDKLPFLDMIYLWYRDVLTAKKLGEEKYVIQKDKKDLIFRQASQETYGGLTKKLEAVWQAKGQLAQNASFQLTIEIMLIKLKES